LSRNSSQAGEVVQVIEHLPSKYEAQSSNPSTAKKEKKAKKTPKTQNSLFHLDI
jgi:hypothetical protein